MLLASDEACQISFVGYNGRLSVWLARGLRGFLGERITVRLLVGGVWQLVAAMAVVVRLWQAGVAGSGKTSRPGRAFCGRNGERARKTGNTGNASLQ
jgi:hypothetical protein